MYNCSGKSSLLPDSQYGWSFFGSSDSNGTSSCTGLLFTGRLVRLAIFQKGPYFNIVKTTDTEKNFPTESIATRLLNQISFIEQPKGKFWDLQSVKSDWLINHIDNAFFNWQTSIHARDLPFDEFLQTLLTYRFRNEALDVPSGFYYTHLRQVLRADSIPELASIIERFNAYTFYADCFEDDGKHLGNLGFYDILQFYKYECSRQSEWTARALNANGIPATFDFTASWLNRNRHHFWVAVRDQSGVYKPFTPKWQSLNDTNYFKRTSKVYRRTLEKQNNPSTLKSATEEIPEVFDSPFIKDVSEQYHTVVGLSIPIKNKINNARLGYVAIFSADGWKPVGWGTIDNERMVIDFDKVPVNVIYIAGTYHNGKLVPLNHPFFLDRQGSMHGITANSVHPTALHLTRKFYKKEDLITKMEAMIGAKFQGANHPNFSDAKDLHILTKKDRCNMGVRAISINSATHYRYLRCLASKEAELNIAIFEVFTSPGPKNRNTAGTLPHALNAHERKLLRTEPKFARVHLKALGDTTGFNLISDENMKTFLTAKELTAALPKPTIIKQIRIAPRNANNGINRGDRYELFYYDSGWRSAGIKTATDNYLDYLNVPANTLYWLRNRDRGKEEQAFLYKDGKQIFINLDDIFPGTIDRNLK